MRSENSARKFLLQDKTALKAWGLGVLETLYYSKEYSYKVYENKMFL
jgi:hypothetical protein